MPENYPYIRPMTDADLLMVLEWRNHSDVRRFMFTQHEISLEEHRNWFDKASLDKSRRLLIVEDFEEAIGYVQFTRVQKGGVTDWGFYKRTGALKGTGLKLGTVALNYAFTHLKVHKVCGQAIAQNQSSIAFHQRLGFTREGVLRDHQRIDGVYHSLHCFGLLASEWQIKRFIQE